MVVALVVLEIEGLAQRANPRHVTSAQKPGLVRVIKVCITTATVSTSRCVELGTGLTFSYILL